jgi:Fe-S-cluster containining protein
MSAGPLAMDMQMVASGHKCRRCGTCCEKGGPCLHHEDRLQVDSGQIPGACLVTFRRGELAWDNVRGELAPLSQEIVKIKGQAGRWSCTFYEIATRGCGIYAYRPLECRVLNCRDTRRIEAVYATGRLTRQDLLSGIQGLWELVQDHERRCSYECLDAWVREGARQGRPKKESALLETLRFDAHVRQLVVEKGGLDARMLDFVFGRPLADTVKMFNLRLVQPDGKYGLVMDRAGDARGD